MWNSVRSELQYRIFMSGSNPDSKSCLRALSSSWLKHWSAFFSFLVFFGNWGTYQSTNAMVKSVALQVAWCTNCGYVIKTGFDEDDSCLVFPILIGIFECLACYAYAPVNSSSLFTSCVVTWPERPEHTELSLCWPARLLPKIKSWNTAQWKFGIVKSVAARFRWLFNVDLCKWFRLPKVQNHLPNTNSVNYRSSVSGF